MAKPDPILTAFGVSVRKHRETKGFTQETLAERADLDRTYLSDVERGTRNLGVKNVVRLAKALGVSASQLLEGVGS
ncbi:MAG: helix-turn-helix transcriptional regulator [Verrucomicrobia bacterium]|nr:helix-turn-helix transcriptional regulator [Verrucomicrobiota bacterium]